MEVQLKSVPFPKSDLKNYRSIGWVVEDVPSDTINVKKTESHILENIACISYGYQIR